MNIGYIPMGLTVEVYAVRTKRGVQRWKGTSRRNKTTDEIGVKLIPSRVTDRQADRYADTQTDRQVSSQIDKQTTMRQDQEYWRVGSEVEKDRQAGRQTGKEVNMKTGRQMTVTDTATNECVVMRSRAQRPDALLACREYSWQTDKQTERQAD